MGTRADAGAGRQSACGAEYVVEPIGGEPPDAARTHESTTGQAAGTWTDAELLERLLAGDARAAVEVYARYVPLLARLARARWVEATERRELVLDLVADIVLRLMRGELRAPRSLGGYLVTALRRRLIDRHRRAVAQPEVVTLEEGRDGGAAFEAGIARAERDATDGEGASLALTALAQHLEAHLDETDRRIVLWLGERIPQRVIAEWLGIGHGALRMRVARLRDRLREIARTYVATLDGDDRGEVARFFRRAATPGRIPPRTPERAPGGRRHGSST